MTNYFPAPANQSEFYAMCQRMSKTSMVPQAFRNHPDDIYVAAGWGAQLGLSPFVSVQNISVINGKPAIFGDLAKAVCYKSGLMTGCAETIEGTGDQMKAVCVVRRKDDPDKHVFEFSVADAKRAGLWGKQGPWRSYPKRMLQMRARGFALRDVFPDVLAGLITAEEAQDYPEEPAASPAKTAAAAPSEAPEHTAQPEAPKASAPRPEDALPVQDAVLADAPVMPESTGPDPDIEPAAAPEAEPPAEQTETGKKIVRINNKADLKAFWGTLSPDDQERFRPLFRKIWKKFM